MIKYSYSFKYIFIDLKYCFPSHNKKQPLRRKVAHSIVFYLHVGIHKGNVNMLSIIQRDVMK